MLVSLIWGRSAFEVRVLAFCQVDVFCCDSFSGNPVAVVLGADELESETMQAIARWTNLSETTFVQRPSVDGADYRIRIFTPHTELPFAGHPSVGTAHAVIEFGVVDEQSLTLIQECGAGLLQLDIEHGDDGTDILVTGPIPQISSVEPGAASALEQILGVAISTGANPLEIDVGPRWLTLELDHPTTLQELAPDMSSLAAFSRQHAITGLNVFSLTDDSATAACVRSFAPAEGIDEDPVCGSGNICVAAHLMCTGRLKQVGHRYIASQGREIGRNGRVLVRVSPESGSIAVGGYCQTRVSGKIRT